MCTKDGLELMGTLEQRRHQRRHVAITRISNRAAPHKRGGLPTKQHDIACYVCKSIQHRTDPMHNPSLTLASCKILATANTGSCRWATTCTHTRWPTLFPLLGTTVTPSTARVRRGAPGCPPITNSPMCTGARIVLAASSSRGGVPMKGDADVHARSQVDAME